jgi:hypothetical protein
MTREHSIERVGIDGFLGCRIFRALGTAANRYLILYELETPDIVGSPAYLARLNAPTPWSQRTMPKLRNFARGGGRIAASSGVGQGGVVGVLPLATLPREDSEALCRRLASMDRIIAARMLLTDSAQTAIETREKGMRTGDRSFAGLLLVEGLDETSVRNALWGQPVDGPDTPLLYGLAFALHKRLLPGATPGT